MNLREYIAHLGLKEFSKRFGVSERAALAWKYRARRPRREEAQKIIEKSGLSWDSIYGPDSDRD